MKRTQRTCGIVVRRSEWSESSRIVSLITREHGRLSLLAKGAQRPKSPFLGAIDLFHVVEARVKIQERRQLQLVYGMKVLQGNRPFRKDLLRYRLACHTSELMRLALPEGRRDDELFELFWQALRWFGAAPRPKLLTLETLFRLRFLQALGALPTPGLCPQSGRELPRTGQVRFDPEHGGFLVRETGPGRQVPARLPWLAGEILALDPSELMRLDPPAAPLRQLHRLLVELVEWQLGSAPLAPLPPELHRS
ncbi:MAG: DNA repair protein RecO [Planctomycetota bacterium]|nr:MAG: DNA repair protein RecO [Planctomycetota bacterium]